MKKPIFISIFALITSTFGLQAQLPSWTTTSGNNLYLTPLIANVGIGTDNPQCKLDVAGSIKVSQTELLGHNKNDYVLLSSLSGATQPVQSGKNIFYKKNFLLRENNGDSWTSMRLHDGISIDVSFGIPGVDTRSWWERDPYHNVQSWGNGSDTYLTINAGKIGIGKVDPQCQLDVNGEIQTEKILIKKPIRINDWNDIPYNGFYDSNDAVNAPEPSVMFWGINMNHSFPSNGSRYGGQIAIKSSPGSPTMYFRSVGENGGGNWAKVLTSEGNPKINGFLSIERGDNLGGYIDIRNSSKTQNGVANSWKIYNMTGTYGNSLQFWAYDQTNCPNGLCANRMTITDEGNVGIGTYPGVKLDVAGVVRAHEVKVCLNKGCDYVFSDDYKLMNLNDLSNFIKTNKHLPEVAPAREMEAEGINLSEMQAKLLQKIEELTLYVIALKNEIDELKK